MADASAAGASAPAVINSSEAPVTPNGTTDGKAATPQEIRKHKLKVNQREVELDDDQYRAAAQKGLAADDVFRRSAEKEKQLAGYFERLGARPSVARTLREAAPYLSMFPG